MERSAKRIPFIVVMLGMVSLFTDAASEMIYPLIPVYVTALGSGALILGIIEGVAESTASLVKLLSGMISDRIGKRKLLVFIGYTLSSLIRPLTGIVTSAWQIVVIRMTDRVGKGIRTAPRDALVASSVDASIRGKSFGFHRAMDHTGAVIGPVLAIISLLVIFSFTEVKDPLEALRWTFLAAIIPGILAILTIIFFIKDPTPERKNGSPASLSLKGLDPDFRNYLLILILFTLGNSSDAFLLFRVEESIRESGAVTSFVMNHTFLANLVSNFGDTEARNEMINILFLPLVWAFFHIIKVIFSTPLGALSDTIGRKRVINIGWAIYAFVYFSFALLVFLPADMQIIATFILFAIYALYYAFTEGAEKALVADLISNEQRGTAYGLYNFAIGLGALPASIIFGFLYSSFNRLLPGFGGSIAFGFGGAIALTAMLLLKYKVKEPGKPA